MSVPIVFRVIAIAVIALVASPSALASDDKYSSRQWNLRLVGAEKAWPYGRGGGVTIAIVDTGVDPSHEDLRGRVVGGYDFVDGDADPRDENGHGTHVAGIAAATAGNGLGVAGVAPDAKIMPIRVLDQNGRGNGGDVDLAVRWAVDHGADVVNLSLGSDIVFENLSGGTLTDAVNYAWSKGVVPVIAAGNEGFFRAELRGAETLIVTATGPDDTLAWDYATEVGFAQWGMAAPGGTDDDGKASMVYSTLWAKNPDVNYGWAMGTSMAAPHVAGAAAILRGAGLSPQQTVDRLLATAKDVGPPGDDFTYGHGRLDVAAAVGGLPKMKVASKGSSTTPDRPTSSSDDTANDQALTPPPAARNTERSVKTPVPESTPGNRPKEDRATPSPELLAAAEDEDEGESSALPNVLAGAALLAAGGAVLALGRLRQMSRRGGG